MSAGGGGSGAGTGGGSVKTPADFLKSIRGRPVVVKLNSGVDYRGNMHSIINGTKMSVEVAKHYAGSVSGYRINA